MYVLITYDVNTETNAGKARLRKVAKLCVGYGQRVQNSVFECSLDPSQLVTIKNKLEKIIDHDFDSIRFYNLGNNYSSKISSLGKNITYDPKDVLII